MRTDTIECGAADGGDHSILLVSNEHSLNAAQKGARGSARGAQAAQAGTAGAKDSHREETKPAPETAIHVLQVHTDPAVAGWLHAECCRRERG